MNDSATRTALTSITPFFIVREIAVPIAFYCDSLGFQLVLQAPGDDPFFALLRRDGVEILVKAIHPDVPPLPNSARHVWARWDAFVHTPEPDALAAEFISRGVQLHAALADTEDRLRGFEVRDPDGYVLFFGRPL